MGKAKAERALKDNEARAVARTLRVSPQKLNLVAQLIRGKKVDRDIAIEFVGLRPGEKLFEEGRWEPFVTGAPVFRDALGVFDCRVSQVVEEGDVSIVIGRVQGVRARGEGAPLLFFRGKFEG